MILIAFDILAYTLGESAVGAENVRVPYGMILISFNLFT